MTPLPLQGVRVADLTMAWAGPHGTQQLADMGAEVIKIEGPNNHDLIRAIVFGGLSATDVGHPYNKSVYFNEFSRNKLGLCLNLADPEGRELFLRFVAICDVVVENYRADVMDKLNLTYEVLKQVKSDIIVVTQPAFSKTGSERNLVGYGPSIEAAAGMQGLSGYRDGGPQKTGFTYCDALAGLGLANVLMLALLYRQRTGKGIYAEGSMRDTTLGVIGETFMEWQMNRRYPPRLGNRHAWMAPHGCYPCKPLPPEEGRPIHRARGSSGEKSTDRWVTIAVGSDDQWRSLCEAMGMAELVEDGRFADAVSRYEHQDELDDIVAAWTREHGDYELMHLLQARGVPAGAVLTPLAISQDPHLEARDVFEVVEHPDFGPNKVTRPSARLSESPAHVRRPAPCFGEHNDYVLGDLLGLSGDEIQALEEKGIISSVPKRYGVGTL